MELLMLEIIIPRIEMYTYKNDSNMVHSTNQKYYIENIFEWKLKLNIYA